MAEARTLSTKKPDIELVLTWEEAEVLKEALKDYTGHLHGIWFTLMDALKGYV